MKVKYADFQQITRSHTVLEPIGEQAEINDLVDVLLEPLFPVGKSIRLLGVTLSSLGEGSPDAGNQLRLQI